LTSQKILEASGLDQAFIQGLARGPSRVKAGDFLGPADLDALLIQILLSHNRWLMCMKLDAKRLP